MQPDNLKAFTEEFKDEFCCDIETVNDAVKRKSMFNIIDFESGYKADFFVLKTWILDKLNLIEKEK